MRWKQGLTIGVLSVLFCSIPQETVCSQESFSVQESFLLQDDLGIDCMAEKDRPIPEMQEDMVALEGRNHSDDGEVQDKIEEGFSYREIENGILEITGYVGDGKELVLPSQIGGKKVTAVGAYAFSGNSRLTRLTLPETVAIIGSHAFWNCSGLVEISLPEGVTEIPKGMMKGCSSLERIVVPESVTKIGYDAFEGCRSLSGLVLPGSLEEVGHEAFAGTRWLEQQPEGIVYAQNVVYDYKGEKSCLITLDLPEGIVGITAQAFKDCRNLQYVGLPDSLRQIGEEAFGNCPSLQKVYIPDNVEGVGIRAVGYESIPDEGFGEEDGGSWVWKWERKTGFQIECSPGSAAAMYAQENGIPYALGSEGKLSGWQELDGKKFYYSQEGVLQTGLQDRKSVV